jgi:hypothetical protein
LFLNFFVLIQLSQVEVRQGRHNKAHDFNHGKNRFSQ